MSEISFLAIPNIEGMRLGWYIQIFGIGILFGVCLFFVIYFLLKYYRKQRYVHHLDAVDQQAQDFGKQLLLQNIQKASGKTKLILFIAYLEKFVTTKTYANPGELLLSQGFTQKDVEEFQLVLYTDKQLSKHSEHRIDTYFTS